MKMQDYATAQERVNGPATTPATGLIAYIKGCFVAPPAPSIDALVRAELDEAHRALLRAETERDRARAAVKFNRARIKRLQEEWLEWGK